MNSYHLPRRHSGFTVLELLIVIGIMVILIALVLVGLNSARKHASNERKASNVQAVVVGLVQYFNICRQYPATLDPAAPGCADLQGKNLKDLIPDIGSYYADPDYHYAGLADVTDLSVCSGFHFGVTLDGPEDGLPHKSGSSPQPSTCVGSASDMTDGSLDTVFDIQK